MAGAEATAVLAVISSIISIVHGTTQIYDAETDTHGLPEAFSEVADRLPIVRAVLGSAKHYIEGGYSDEESCHGARPVIENCKMKAKKVEELFRIVMSGDGAPRAEKYIAAARTLGRGSQVEALMKGMLEDLQQFAINHEMAALTEAQQKDIADAIEELGALPSSIPDQVNEGSRFSAFHSGSGAINQSQGNMYNIGSGQFYQAQNMNFGSNGKR